MWPECPPAACAGLLDWPSVLAGCWLGLEGHQCQWGRQEEDSCGCGSAVAGHYTLGYQRGKGGGDNLKVKPNGEMSAIRSDTDAILLAHLLYGPSN